MAAFPTATANKWSLIRDQAKAKRSGVAALEQRQAERLADLVAYARAKSPLYRKLYDHLPSRVSDRSELPVTEKQTLMGSFNEWVTDRAVTYEEVRQHIDDPGRIGAKFLSKYTVATTSGSTGARGIFLMDEGSFAVTRAMGVRMLRDWLSIGDLARIARKGGRLAMVAATGGHFASAVAGARLTQNGSKRVQVLPVTTPLQGLVEQLNHFQPALLAPYASIGALLAGEQRSGNLRIAPALVVLSAEGLSERERIRIADALGAKVRDSYAATECPFLSYRCEYDWLHVNSDWVLFEPVDHLHQPVRPGEESHTVLLTNLANRIQPIIRYDLGDRIVAKGAPCGCGNLLPAIRVRGRSADVLTFAKGSGERVTLSPLAFVTTLDAVQGVDLSQIVQTTRGILVRLKISAGADEELVWADVEKRLRSLLAKHGLPDSDVERASQQPAKTAGGKYRRVIPLVPEGERFD